MTSDDVGSLACLGCHAPLAFEGSRAAGHIVAGKLRCTECGSSWPVEDGLPRLVDERRVSGIDRMMRFVYDWIAPLHDPATSYLLPWLQGASEETTRDGHMRRLRVGDLRRGDDGRAPRILEVGVGSGGNLPWLERDLPPGLDVELWGVDLSPQMLEHCRRRLARPGSPTMRLAVADGHALPFPDSSFDRVYNVGGIGTYADPRRALAEMARVARPGTPIVVVDEQLDPHRRHPFYYRLIFRALTLYDPAPRSPVAHLPADAVNVTEEQVSRFYYCLAFEMPARPFFLAPRAARLDRTLS
jgi:ubiquinone/menaquinone biosynthesis C-methylase UbiE/uncharacterized protein YbaR (Trm112 family)